MRVLSLAVILVLTSIVSAAPEGDKLVAVKLVADTAAIEPGKPFRVAVHFTVEPKWHIYWIHPGDSGQPPEVNWTLPPGFVAGELSWPVPHRFDLPGGIVNYGYDGEVALIATITPPKKIERPTAELSAEINWLVCDPDLCLPGSGAAKLSLPVGTATAANSDEFQRWNEALPGRIGDAGVPASLGSDAGAFRAGGQTIVWSEAVSDVQWFIATPDAWTAEQVQVSSRENVTQLSARITPIGGNKPEPARIYTVVAYSTKDGARKGIEYWLHVSPPPGAGGGVQPAR